MVVRCILKFDMFSHSRGSWAAIVATDVGLEAGIETTYEVRLHRDRDKFVANT